MAGIRVMNALKDKESFIGEVDEVMQTTAVFKTSNGNSVKLPLPEHVLETINENHNSMFGGDIIKITREGDEFIIEPLEDFPDEKAK